MLLMGTTVQQSFHQYVAHWYSTYQSGLTYLRVSSEPSVERTRSRFKDSIIWGICQEESEGNGEKRDLVNEIA